MKHVFIITFGRTGSTALLKALNAIDGACIRGQNGGILRYVAESVESLREHKREKVGRGEPGAGNPWYGIDEVNVKGFAKSLAEAFERNVLAPPPGTRITGFKDIRYTDEVLNDRQFESVLRFLLDNFDDPHVIFLTRDPAEACKSGWWQDRDQDVVIDVLEMTNERFRNAHAAFPRRTFLIDHSEFDGTPAGLQPLLHWLGEDIPEAALTEALSARLLHLH